MKREVAVLALMQVPGVGPVKLRKGLAALCAAQIPIEDATSPDGRAVLATAGIDAPLALSAEVSTTAERLARADVRVEVIAGEDWTPWLSHGPSVLFVRGSQDVLRKRSIGFCGSREATPKGLDVAADIASQVAEQGLNVVSGGARGVDTVTHVWATRKGGTTTIVLAEGILEWKPRAELREITDDPRTIVVSEFAPTARWMAARAMQRNETICALSLAMVLIEARSTGGTFAAGNTALRMGVPLFCVNFRDRLDENDGNRILTSKGAHAMKMSRTLGRANITPMLDAVGKRPETNGEVEAAAQLRLWKSG